MAAGRLLVLFSLVEAVVLVGAGWASRFATLAILCGAVELATEPGRYRTEVFAWLSTFMWAG
ncbi:hypothetical protein [Nonomuraea ceibae]|uniref:hypothetical protein n=1 Tax=Nonomuraea ceibae TaxID=1935170 RepID=UPI001C6068A6|nr:hypothetical protein [Nonomuraea ceibae]